MVAKLIDGKKLAAEIRANIKKQVVQMKEKPGLAAVLVGNDPGSLIYIKKKLLSEILNQVTSHMLEINLK